MLSPFVLEESIEECFAYLFLLDFKFIGGAGEAFFGVWLITRSTKLILGSSFWLLLLATLPMLLPFYDRLILIRLSLLYSNLEASILIPCFLL